ncbi:MAG: hypothetical protein R3B52_00810 [Candidatus Paceibacterota bacterium]
MKRNTLIVTAIVLLAVLPILVSQKPKKEPEGEKQEQQESEEQVAQEKPFDITDIGATDGADAGYMYQQVRSETYSFSKIRWEFFELEQAGELPYSLVRIYLDDFQIDGRPIKLGGFKLGTHQGTCSEMKSSLDMSGTEGEPRSFAMCWWAGAGTEFVVTQNADIVHVYTRTVEEQAENFAPLHEILTIDMTKLVL